MDDPQRSLLKTWKEVLNMDEIYKDYYYKGTKTNYMISNKGNVYSKNIKRNLKLTPNTRGYLRVAIHIPGERTHVVSVHSMVIETFKGPKPSPEYQIDHIDGDKSNNYVENLEWVTASENILRAFKNGLKEGVKGSDHPVSVYTDEQIHKACKLLEQGMTIPDTAKEKPMTGEVIAVGCGKKDEPMTVKVGDKILYGKYSGTEINIDGNDYLIMRENDIYAII